MLTHWSYVFLALTHRNDPCFTGPSVACQHRAEFCWGSSLDVPAGPWMSQPCCPMDWSGKDWGQMGQLCSLHCPRLSSSVGQSCFLSVSQCIIVIKLNTKWWLYLSFLHCEWFLGIPRIIQTLTEINSSPPGQNGSHFPANVFKCIFGMKTFVFWSEFHWSLFLRVQLTISQHWFR